MKSIHRALMLTIMVFILVGLATSCDRRNIPVILDQEPVPVSSERYITSMVASPDTIYADHNITYSLIRVQVKDGEGFGVPDQIVSFKTDIGRVLTNVPTDSTGVATTTFWDDGAVGEATVTAVVRKYSEEDAREVISEAVKTTKVTILEVPSIQSISLEPLIDPIPLRVMQTIELTATVVNVLGNYVPNNTLVTFTCDKGSFLEGSESVLGTTAVVKTSNGRARISYSAGQATTNPGETPKIRASVGAVSSTRTVLISSGLPAAMRLETYVIAAGDSINTDNSPMESNNEIRLSAKLTDLYGNVCAGSRVKFTTDLGTFINTSQTINVSTQANGRAETRLIPGLQAGAATITASANGDTLLAETIFTITSSQLHSISFTQEQKIKLDVAGTGGDESAILRVKLKDINGNLIDTQKEVWFKIIGTNPIPAGANLNNQSVLDSVMVLSTGGEAQISVNAGTEAGILVIRASHTRESDGAYIKAIKANIIIQGGPPATVTPFIGLFNTGQSMGGGLWRVIAGAAVYDVYGNPVSNSTMVHFQLLDNTLTNCTIGADGSVGNVSVDDDSLPAVAYTTLTYPGVYTNEMITIQATTGAGSGNAVHGYATVALPLNDPRFEIQANPASINFGDTGPDWKNVDIYCKLTDGQGAEVGNQEIMLLSTRGQFVAIPGYNNDYPVAPAWLIKTDTGQYGIGDKKGWAWGQIRFHRLECPAGDPQTQTPGQTGASIIGRILGTGVTDMSDVIIFRYWTPNPPF